jgi:hypothetical protein
MNIQSNMNRRHFLPVAVVIVVVVTAGTPIVSGEQVIGQPNIELSTPANEVSPGERTSVDLYLTNDGRLTQSGAAEWVERVTTARGTAVEVRSGDSPIEVHTGTITPGTVPSGTSGPFEVSITVPEGTEPGVYELPVRLSYSYTSIVTYGQDRTEFDESFRSRRATLRVEVTESPQFEVTDTTSSAQIGDEGRVSVRIQNIGQERASDTAVSIKSASDEITFGTGSKRSESFVGDWPAGETRSVTYSIQTSDDAVLRQYSLSTVVEYTDSDGIDGTSRSMKTGVTPGPEQTFALTDLEASLRVGEEGRLEGVVENTGPAPVTNAVVRFGSSSRNINAESREYAIDNLAVGETARFGYDVTVSEAASASRRQFNFSVRYRNERGDQRFSDALERTAEINPQRNRFAVTAVDSSVVSGNTSTLQIEVTNQGDEPLRNVEAKAFLEDPLSSGDDEGLIPKLAPGESKSFTIGLSAGNDALAKTYPVSIDFQYEMPDGDTEVSQSYTVPVEVQPSSDSGPPILVLGVIAGIVLLIGASWWWRRRSE